ncbi:hypothetical protein FNV43_RR06541 [Rhamnella rubrinervis]|uniref:Cysteine-rich receptor-like protein kinase 29 n=1 Tax=Rhamnella rubrinervis TaxID=2594499 RepID=A0A8K0MLW1_9ROSA|nr:hypothetical protein FNV43_RR06541 [Rhamnella rubrinervis]
MGLCRGDIKPEACRSCLNDSTNSIKENCPNQKEAIEWYAECMLRYSNRSIFGVVETDPRYRFYNVNNVTSNVDDFYQVLNTLLRDLKDKAAAGGSRLKHATGNAAAPNFQTIYAQLQCTPDLSQTQCTSCLDVAMADIPRCCDGKQSAVFISPSCTLRFELYIFYEPSSPIADAPPPSPPPPSINNRTTTQGKKSNTSRTIIIVVVPTVAGVVLIISIYACLRGTKAKKKFQTLSAHEAVDEIATTESLQYDFNTIRVATDNFSVANKLGQGGFGAVYRGRLHNGEDIAVKRLSRDSGQGQQEFKNEVLLVAKLQHRNLVKLLGFCFDRNERLLVYEFAPNSSLDHFIFDPMKRANLDWNKRYKIIGGIARGLLYLHEDSRLRIIHRDLKASNILLDEEMNPKISDFGMARLFVVDQTQANTSRIVGTYGYMAPEYAMNGHFSVKSDVYSFGVLLLEIISGQKNNCFRDRENVQDLLNFAWKNWREGTASNVVDGVMRGGSTSEIMRCIHIALLCVQENSSDRPTMNSIVLMLNSNSVTLSVPSRPAFFLHSGIDESTTGSSGFVEASTKEASITDLFPR